MQPWDKERFRIPGGAPYSPNGMMTWAAANAIYRRETYDNYPAQRAIMSCVYEGLSVPDGCRPCASRRATSPRSAAPRKRAT